MTAAGAAMLIAVLAAGPSAPVPWDQITDKERQTLQAYLEAPEWPVRAFGLLRLQRYEGQEVGAILRRHAASGPWQARCFAFRAARDQGIEVPAPSAEALSQEPRLLRAALRYGLDIEAEAVQRTARSLMRTRELDSLLLGMEIAAGSGQDHLRAEASRRATALIRDMSPQVETIVRGRLGRLLGADPVPEGREHWQRWLRRQPANRAPIAGGAPRGTHRPSVVAELDPESFDRLLDYLGILKQQHLDLGICIDSTNSMRPMIDEVRAGVDALIRFFNDVAGQMRLGVVAYRDHDNKPVWEGEQLTDDVRSLRRFLFALRITGGRDLPEAVLNGLAAASRLEWSPGATHLIVLVGDARPHDGDVYQVLELAESCRNRGITIHAVHVPQRLLPQQLRRGPPDYLERVEYHNAKTAEVFGQIAAAGGGRKATVQRATELVPQFIHAVVEEAWWPVFDEFHALYLDLCR